MKSQNKRIIKIDWHFLKPKIRLLCAHIIEVNLFIVLIDLALDDHHIIENMNKKVWIRALNRCQSLIINFWMQSPSHYNTLWIFYYFFFHSIQWKKIWFFFFLIWRTRFKPSWFKMFLFLLKWPSNVPEILNSTIWFRFSPQSILLLRLL